MIEPRYRHACTSFWLNGEHVIMVTPGYPSSSNATEFLNLNQENPQWIPGTFYQK